MTDMAEENYFYAGLNDGKMLRFNVEERVEGRVKPRLFNKQERKIGEDKPGAITLIVPFSSLITSSLSIFL